MRKTRLSILGGLLVAVIFALPGTLQAGPEQGTTAGEAFDLSGNVSDEGIAPELEVTLPPGGVQVGEQFELVLGGGLVTVRADAVTVACSNDGPNDLTVATCFTEVSNLRVTDTEGLEIVRAATLRAQSASVGRPGEGFQSTSLGTVVQGLCVTVQDGAPCVSLAQGETVDVEVGALSGTIAVQVEEARDSDNDVEGSGLRVTLLRLDLDAPGPFGGINLDAIVADTFAGEPAGGSGHTEAELFEGWNPVDYAGPPVNQPDLDASLDAIISPSDAWSAVARFDGIAWLTHFADPPLPAFNTLDGLAPGLRHWFFATSEARLDTTPIE